MRTGGLTKRRKWESEKAIHRHSSTPVPSQFPRAIGGIREGIISYVLRLQHVRD